MRAGGGARTAVVVAIIFGLALQQLYRSLQFQQGVVIIRSAPDTNAEGNNGVTKTDMLEPPENNYNTSGTNATFLGMNLSLSSGTKSSLVHCVGDNFLPKTSAGYRSCQFRHLCWDLQVKDFVIFESPQHKRAAELQHQMGSMYVRSSFDFNTTVSTSATTEDRLRQGLDGNWFPRTVTIESYYHGDTSGFYELPQDIVLVPVWFPEDGTMPTKDLLFDFLLPIYNLLAMFDLQGKTLLLMNLNPSCSATTGQSNGVDDCYRDVLQLLPLVMNNNRRGKDAGLQQQVIFMSMHDQSSNANASKFVCSKYGAAGIGALTDHGIHKKSHGERKKDYAFVQNSGRGPLLYAFRNHMLSNMGLLDDDSHSLVSLDNKLPLKMIVSVSQSKKSGVQDFQDQIEAIRGGFPPVHLSLESYNMSTLPLMQQLKIATETSIYISVMGEGALPAFFLPRGATLILFYNDNNEFVSVTKRETAFPMKLDWDLWNNLGYISVHWLPLSTKNRPDHLGILLKLIQDEIQHEASQQVPPTAINSKEVKGPPDGTFNGMDVHLVEQPQTSKSHCIGDNFQENAHAMRSCEFEHFCLDLSQENRDFSLVTPKQQSTSMLDQSTYISTNMSSAVTLGRTIRFHNGSGWFPVVSKKPYDSYYELSDDLIWIPFYAEQPNIHNPGHLLWDYFLPFFNLLAMFGLEDRQVFLSNVDDACTEDEGDDSRCWNIISKFLPLLGVNSASFHNTKHSALEIKGVQRSNIVCAKRSVAGIGMLTDHGWNRHGQRIDDYRDVHNIGRGPLFFAFRNYVVRKMGISEEHADLKQPHKIVFSKLSSKNPARRLSFEKQIEKLGSVFPSNEVTVEGHVLSKMSLEEQIKLATETTVFVSVVGGSACFGTFLPRGSTIILFFNDAGGEFVDRAKAKDFPAMIDWDFWNNASFLRVHWLPISRMEEATSLQALTELIRNEIATFDDVSG